MIFAPPDESLIQRAHIFLLDVVIQHEEFSPTVDSKLGKAYGVCLLKRRYTNVYVLRLEIGVVERVMPT
jgi:hypothetical protein